MLRKLILGLAVTIGLVALFPAVAMAQVSDQVVVGGDRVITFPVWAYTLGTGWFIPILVGLVTKINAPSGVKIVVSIIFNAINGVIGTITVLGGNAILSVPTLVMAGLSLVTALATYAGIWKPLNAQSHLAPNVGIGPANP